MRGQGQVENPGKTVERKARDANQQPERSTTGQPEKIEASGKSASELERRDKAASQNGSPAQHGQKSARDLKKENGSTNRQASSNKSERSTVGQSSSGRNEASKTPSSPERSSRQQQPDKSTPGSTEQSQTKASNSGERNGTAGVAVAAGSANDRGSPRANNARHKVRRSNLIRLFGHRPGLRSTHNNRQGYSSRYWRPAMCRV